MLPREQKRNWDVIQKYNYASYQFLQLSVYKKKMCDCEKRCTVDRTYSMCFVNITLGYLHVELALQLRNAFKSVGGIAPQLNEDCQLQ